MATGFDRGTLSTPWRRAAQGQLDSRRGHSGVLRHGDWLIKFLEHRDRRVLIRKWLNAGVMERHRCGHASGCQPLRTCFHVLDLWFHKASEGSERSSDHCPGRYCGRVPAGCGDIPSRRSGEAALVSPFTRTIVEFGRGAGSTSWASRTSARRPGEDASGSVAKRVAASRRCFAIDGITTYGRSAGLSGLVQLLRRPRPMAAHVPPQAATPVDASDPPPLPAPPF